MSAVSTLRAPTESDVARVAHLMSETWPDPVGEDDVRRAWTAPGFDLERDARLDGDDAYCRLAGEGEGRVWIDLRGRPSEALLEWAEARAAELGTRFLSGSWTISPELLRALETRGYVPIRNSLRMTIDLVEPTPAPDWPAGIVVRSFEPGDERAFHAAQQETFEDTWEHIEEPFEEWSHWLLQPPLFDPALWFLALDGAEPAGFAICHARSGAPESAVVRLLGVRRPWRRRGLGRALLLHAFSVLRERGFARAGLGVDAESSTGAHTLYESAGMHEAARFVLVEKAAP